MRRIQVYDSTLRDGAQGEGISFSTEDKLRIAAKLDELGIDYIEGGFPGANPKDREFFRRIRETPLSKSKITAFGSTRRGGVAPEDDPGLKGLVEAGVSVATVFGKSWDLHVDDVLRVTKDENLKMIEESVAFLKAQGLEVIYDAEHFFDGYQADPDYALATLQAAHAGGPDCIVLCDTNGGSLPFSVTEAIERVRGTLTCPLGIHVHNDAGMAVANSVLAVQMGVDQVQGTINGYGERCGNANLCSVIPTIRLKLGLECLDGHLDGLTEASRFVSELANLSHNEHQPYVGNSAFAHKGGMHVDAVRKNPRSFEHVEPELTGNVRRFLISELSGRSTILAKAEKYNPDLKKDTPEVNQLRDVLEDLEHQGYLFEGAEGSFELLLMRTFGKYQELFHRVGFRVIIEKREDGTLLSEATIKVRLHDEEVHTAAEGDGPVNALDNALRKALTEWYPDIAAIDLTDYKVRVIDEKAGTASKVRVLIESSDGHTSWGTVGVSENLVEASWQALVESIEYGLLCANKEGKPAPDSS